MVLAILTFNDNCGILKQLQKEKLILMKKIVYLDAYREDQENKDIEIWLATVDNFAVFEDITQLQKLIDTCPDKKNDKYHWLLGVVDTRMAISSLSEI